jgi:acyl-CoA thioesterase I
MNNYHVAHARRLARLALVLLLVSSVTHAQVVAFGASNVSGWNVPASAALPAQLRAMLHERGYTTTVANAGIYGNTTTEMRARAERDIPEGTTVVVLDMTGGLYNDAQKGISREQGEADLAAIRARLAERHITIIPFSAAELPAQYHQADGAHLTAEGHHVAAQQLLPQITAALGPPAAAPTVREACMADARRLCADALGDDARRHECMAQHRAELSKDCLHAIAASRQSQGK